MRENEELKYDLFENGLDFISSGLNHVLNDSNSGSFKYAILHISAGIELVLKDSLRREHWSLIFENTNNAEYHLLKSGEFKSVDFESIISRIENICEISISSKELIILRNIKKIRNKIEHFEFSENVLAIKSLCSKALSFLINFINENYEHDKISKLGKKYIEDLRIMSGKFKEFTKLRNAQIKVIIDNAIYGNIEIECCPICRQATLILDNELQCAFCGYSDSPGEIAKLYSENILGKSYFLHIKDGEDYPVGDCFHCNSNDTFVNKGNDYICFQCFETNHKSEIKECPSCGQLHEKSEDDIEICDYCYDEKLKDWD